MTKIHCEGLNFQVHNKVLIQNLNLIVESGKCVVFLGPSGCGKSTLLKLLAGLLTPTGGKLQKTFKKQGFVFQDSQLLDWRTALENVKLPLEIQKEENQLQKSLNALKLVDLVEAQDLFPYELSGGMKMRVNLARALVNHPDLLFLDEPFSALDEITREQMQINFREMQNRFKWLSFLVTHSLSEALLIADHIHFFDSPGIVSNNYVTVERSYSDLNLFKRSPLYFEQLDLLKQRVGVLAP